MTILRWGNAWFVPGSVAALPGDGSALVAHFEASEKPVRLRVIWCPDGFETAPVSCPKAGRNTLAMVLGEEFPALVDPARSWSYEPVLPLKESFTTLLHFEGQPELFAMIHELESAGLVVEAAWPLATWLQALPKEWPENGAQTIAAVDGERVLAWRHGSDGVRMVEVWHGETAIAEFAQWLGKLPNAEPVEPILLIGTGPEILSRLAGDVGLAERPGVEWMEMSEALAGASPIPRDHPGQLLPRPPFWSASRAVALAASALLLAAGCWGGLHALRLREAAKQEAALTHEAEKARLVEQETAASSREAAAIEASLAKLRGRLQLSDLVTAIAGTIPPEVTLSTLHVDSGDWNVGGFVAPGTNGNVWPEWLKRLEPLHPRAIAAPVVGVEFTLQGRIGG